MFIQFKSSCISLLLHVCLVCCFKAKEELHSELVALRIEYNNEQQSSTQAAATLAATNAARQTEMEMQIEKMQKEIGKSDLRP
jgi:TolA-binding protein